MKYTPTISIVLLLLATACGSTKFTPIGQRYPARERKCEIQMFTTVPTSGFVQIGSIDVKSGSYGANQFRDPDSLKRDIRLTVCEAGGDAVVAQVNAKGLYDKAFVLKAVASEPTPAPAVAQPAPAPAPAATAGCSFDAQCKGDRICVNGACVSPASATPGK